MAAFNILFTDVSKAVIGGITLDASIRESHSDQVSVTDNPIESGGMVSDHAYEQPFSLSIEGFVTDSPVRLLSGVRSFFEGQDPDGIIGDLVFPAGLTRSASANRALKALKAAREPITVQTGLDVYRNMLITSYVRDRDKTKGKALWFTMGFKQVDIVDSETINIPAENVSGSAPVAPDDRTPDQAAAEQDVGKKATTQADERETTILASLFDALSGNN